METIVIVLRIVGAIVGALGLLGATLAGLAAFAYWLFKRFAAGWLENRFKKELADHQHAHNREIEGFRGEVATLLGRSTKIHDKEFSTLEEAWEKASIAMGSASGVLALLQQAPDVSWKEGAELDYILERCELPEWQVAEVKALDRMARSTKLYGFMMDKNRIQANRDWHEFHRFVILKGIFLKPDVEAKARELSNLIGELLDENAWSNQEDGATGLRSRRELNARIRDDGSKLRDEVRVMIAARLWDVDLNKV